MNLQWWCSAQNAPWSWTWQPYPGVWVAVVLLAAVIFWVRKRRAPEAPAWPAFAAPALVWLALDWPVGTLGAGYLASVHAAKFLLLALAAPPLLWLAARPVADRAPHPAHARLAPALLAAVVFNAVLITTHVPSVVDFLTATQPGSFANDALWLGAGVLFWWPVVTPTVLAHPLAKIAYVFFGALSHTGLGIFLLLAKLPLYRVYELAPRVGGISARVDQGLAGAVMLLGGSAIIFGTIGYLFYRLARSQGEPIAS